ncbi:MAG: T9SS type A sorting domain-containing protein [Bacteroidales bacterium]|nr:T9SS type A sorting domain-containing protein [Bacteroidales bacterium]
MKRFKIPAVAVFFLIFFGFIRLNGQTEDKKVLIHYMGWFGAGEHGRHWSCKQPHTPLIGYYSSLSWATQMYHILLSWSCGIDGLVINVKDIYDEECMKTLVQTLKRLYAMNLSYFSYDYSISYDDQGLLNTEAAINKFMYLRDYILPEPIDFLRYNGTPAVFAFNYPNEYLTAEQYSAALDDVFPTGKPILVWNQIESTASGYVNSFYPWVEPGGNVWNGTNWGKVYLDWFYPELDKYSNKLDFVTGGVWAGFDDRNNECWGGTRWIDRQEGWVYEKTWEYINNYSGIVPIQWVLLETWNDWNEGTEIEPSLESGYQYLIKTIESINGFKGKSISTDTVRFEQVKDIYSLADSIERGLKDSATCYPQLENAVRSLVQKYPVSCCHDIHSSSSLRLDMFPNPASSEIRIITSFAEELYGSLVISDMNGRIVEILHSGRFTIGKNVFVWNSPAIQRGIYICSFQTNRGWLVKKIILF